MAKHVESLDLGGASLALPPETVLLEKKSPRGERRSLWTLECALDGAAAEAHFLRELARCGFAVNTSPWDGYGFVIKAAKPELRCDVDGFAPEGMPLTVLLTLTNV
jgi:hypothetical protein